MKFSLVTESSPTRILGKAKPYPSEMEKVAQDEIKSKINEIETAINDGDQTLDEKIKTVRLNLESVKNGMTDQIEQVQVSYKIIDGVECEAFNECSQFVIRRFEDLFNHFRKN